MMFKIHSMVMISDMLKNVKEIMRKENIPYFFLMVDGKLLNIQLTLEAINLEFLMIGPTTEVIADITVDKITTTMEQTLEVMDTGTNFLVHYIVNVNCNLIL